MSCISSHLHLSLVYNASFLIMTKGEKNIRTSNGLCMVVLTCLVLNVYVFMVILDWIFGLFECLNILWKTIKLLEYCGHDCFCISRGFLNFQRKLCPNFQFFNMHMFRGSLLSFIESLL